MYYVICPTCEARVEVATNAIGLERSDFWNVTACDECGTGFDYDETEVVVEEEPGN